MNWLRRLLGIEPPTPQHVQDGLNAAAEAVDAADQAELAVRDYWSARRVDGRVRSDAVIDEYQRADEARTRRRADR